MNDKIVTFAALKSFYDSGQDLLGVFGNLIILVISENSTSISRIKKDLKDKMAFDIPQDVIHTIVKRLHKNNFVSYKNIKNPDFKSISLTLSGKEKEQKIRQDFENAKREKAAMVKSLKQNHSAYSELSLLKELDNFIENSTQQAIAILDGSSKNKDCVYTQSQLDIANFFISAEKSDPENYQRLKLFLYGKIIANAFLSGRFNTTTKIEKLEIYLDTNIVFSLMGFHEELYNEPVKEVVELVKNNGATLKVFSFTLIEIKNKLRGYLNEYGFYSAQIPVGSIYYTLKKKGLSKLDVISLIENLEETLIGLGVEVDYIFEQDDLLKDKESELSKLSSCKLNSSISSVRYDLAALLAIKKIRRNADCYLWEKSSAIFLSADHRLVAYDFIEHGHKESGTFPEVIFRSDMASLFWLKGKSGSDNAFLHNLFASYIRSKIINTNLWVKFINELKKRLGEGVLSQEDIERVISLSETEVILREQGEGGIKEILNDDNIQKIKSISITKDKNLAENERTIIEQADQLSKINEAIIADCKNFWNKAICTSIWLIVFIAFVIIIISLYKFGLSTVSGVLSLTVLVTVIIMACSVTLKKEVKFLDFIIKLREKLENKLITKCIEKKRRKYKILDTKQ